MKSEIKWKKWEEHTEIGRYLVAIRQKYKWEDEWEEFITYACYTYDRLKWVFDEDWNEGQEYEYIGIARLDEIPFPRTIDN